MDITELSAPPYNINLQINNGYSAVSQFLNIKRKTANHTLVLSDASSLIDMDLAVENTVTVPLHTDVPFEIGTVIEISQYGAGKTVVDEVLGVTIRSDVGLRSISRYKSARLIKIADNEWYLFGPLVP